MQRGLGLLEDFDRKLRKIPFPECWLGGVLSGFAYYLGVPCWVLRLIFMVLCLLWLPDVLVPLYILFWIFLPKWDKAPEDFLSVTGD